MFVAEGQRHDPLSFEITFLRLFQLRLQFDLFLHFALIEFEQILQRDVAQIHQHIRHFDVLGPETRLEKLQGLFQIDEGHAEIAGHGKRQAERVEKHAVFVMFVTEFFLDDDQRAIDEFDRLFVSTELVVNLSDVVQNLSRFRVLRAQSFLDRRQRASVQLQRGVEPISFSVEIGEIVEENSQFVMFLFVAERLVNDLDRSPIELLGSVVIGLFLPDQAERVEHLGHLDVLRPVGPLQRGQRFVISRFSRFEISLLKTKQRSNERIQNEKFTFR